jgi:glycosyltransferase involved in cell wall biosynthesis
MDKELELKKNIIESKSNNKKNLWVITELYYPENNQTGYYMTGIAEGLTEKFNVRVICGQPNYAAKGTLAPKKEFYKNVEIFRVWSTTLDKDIIFFRLINMLTIGFSIFFKILANVKKNEVILVVSAPPTLPFIAALAAKILRGKYNLIIQDKYPETLTAVGKLSPKSLTVKILNRLNVWLYLGASKIIVVGRDMKMLVLSQLQGFSNSKNKTPEVKVIQNWASLEEIEPLPRDDNELLKELQIADKFIFLYAGNMGYPQDIESIVKCAEKLKTDERFHFLFIGSGVKKRWLEREVLEKSLINITILAPRSRNEQKIFLNACDVGLVPLVKKMWGVAMPSRTYNLLAAGKPVLALTENDSEVAKVIEDDQVGWFVSPNDPEALFLIIIKIFEDRQNLKEMGARARGAAQLKYSVEAAVSKYNELLA